MIHRKTSWTTSKTSWNTLKTLWNIMKHSNTHHLMWWYRRSMRRRRCSMQRRRRSMRRCRHFMFTRLRLARQRLCSRRGHLMRRYQHSLQRSWSIDAEASALWVVTSVITQSSRQYWRGVFGDCGVGVTPQMCNRVTNHGDMSTFSRPVRLVTQVTLFLEDNFKMGIRPISWCQYLTLML